MTEILLDFAFDVVLGVAIGLLALALPFRHLAGRPKIAKDAAAAIATAVFAVGMFALLQRPTDWAVERIETWYAAIDDVAWWIVVPSYIVLADLGAYFAHRVLHTRWLWSTHAWHHSPTHLYWLSGLRGSPIHVLVLAAPYFLAAIVFPAPETGLLGLGILFLDVSNQHYIHSNLRVPFVKQLERVFVTPRFHFVHHSTTPQISNSNYGFIFSFWDRLFGTYTDPETIAADDALGLDYEVSEWRLVLGLPSGGERKR